MRAAAFETVLPNTPITMLPLNLTLTHSRVSPLLMVALALPAALAALTPFWLIARHADASFLISRPETSIPLAAALIAWALLFGWPIMRQASRIGQSRHIAIAGGRVHVVDRGLFGPNAWSEPLLAYAGLAHHVRASLSGNRHELLLIHPDPSRSVLLRAAETIHQQEINVLTGLLGCREIAPRMFYRKPDRGSQTYPAARGELAAVR